MTLLDCPRVAARRTSSVGNGGLVLARQTAIIVAGFAAYLGVRAIANGSEDAAFRHAQGLLEFESSLGLDVERSVQAAALNAPLLIDAVNFIYAWTYWPFIIGGFVVTWFWKRELFVIYRNAMTISGAIGLVVFAVVPVAPPRFLDGFVDTVDPMSRSNFVAHPAGMINEFAALPSFHVGWVALASATIALGVSRRWLQGALTIPTIMMSVSVVLTGNHYVIDIIAGLGLSSLAFVIAVRRSRCAGASLTIVGGHDVPAEQTIDAEAVTPGHDSDPDEVETGEGTIRTGKEVLPVVTLARSGPPDGSRECAVWER